MKRRYFARRVWNGQEIGQVIKGNYASRDNFVTYALERKGLGGVFNIYRASAGASFYVSEPCGQVVLSEIVEMGYLDCPGCAQSVTDDPEGSYSQDETGDWWHSSCRTAHEDEQEMGA